MPQEGITPAPGAVSRREWLARLAAGASLVTLAEAQHAHDAVAREKQHGGAYQPKALTAHEYATLEKLSDLILPADEHSPGALEAGAAGFIDFLCAANSDLRDLYTGGLMWLDEAMEHDYAKTFLEAAPGEQTAMLDKIAYRKNASPELNPGIQFFAFCRRMVADAYYTTPLGYKEVGYMGNSGMAQFSVPNEALDYALKRSGLG
jgi:gluconate 2-dehydrogenase gamma chain